MRFKMATRKNIDIMAKLRQHQALMLRDQDETQQQLVDIMKTMYVQRSSGSICPPWPDMVCVFLHWDTCSDIALFWGARLSYLSLTRTPNRWTP